MNKFIIIISLTLAGCFSGGSSSPKPVSDSVDIQVTWLDNSDNEDEFIVSRRYIDEEEFTIIDYLYENTTSYIDVDLDNNEVYCYKVTASNEYGESDSKEVCSK